MEIQVIVTVDADHLGRINEVVRQLRAAGMLVDQVLSTLGIVTGSVSSAQLVSLEAIPGVASVEEETSFQIAPPDADVQ
jgi:hypothetical protein